MTRKPVKCAQPLCLLAALTAVSLSGQGTLAEPLKGGIEERGYNSQPMSGYADYPAYPAPKMMPLQGQAAQTTSRPMQGGVQQSAPPPRPPIQAGVQKVQLPPQFLGLWNVQGQRTKVQAQPEFQAGAERSFAMSTQNTWEIGGNPVSGYTMGSNSGVKTPLVVDQVQGNTAFIRYQHPVGNTMAQEAIVMSLQPGGAQFSGLERISIIKENQPPRAQVTYQLTGFRQR